MIKKLILILIFTLCISGSVFAYPTQKITPEISSGMKQYRAGNYTGCIETLLNYTEKHKNEENQIVAYYLGMAYTQAGQRDEAIKYYELTTKIFPNNELAKYAKKGIACVNGDESICNPKPVVKVETENKTELDKFVKAPYGNGLSSDLTKELERRRLEALRKKINSDVEINRYEFKDFRDFSKKTSMKEDGLLIASSKPSDAEVLKAIRVLNDAGLNNIAGQAEASMNARKNESINNTNTKDENTATEVQYQNKPDLTADEYQRKIQKEMMQAQIESMAQPNINALFGNSNNNNGYNNNNNMMNMLPFLMMSQSQQNNANGNGTVDARQQAAAQEMMQAIMLNQMMPNFNFGSSNNGGF